MPDNDLLGAGGMWAHDGIDEHMLQCWVESSGGRKRTVDWWQLAPGWDYDLLRQRARTLSAWITADTRLQRGEAVRSELQVLRRCYVMGVHEMLNDEIQCRKTKAGTATPMAGIVGAETGWVGPRGHGQAGAAGMGPGSSSVASTGMGEALRAETGGMGPPGHVQAAAAEPGAPLGKSASTQVQAAAAGMMGLRGGCGVGGPLVGEPIPSRRPTGGGDVWARRREVGPPGVKPSSGESTDILHAEVTAVGGHGHAGCGGSQPRDWVSLYAPLLARRQGIEARIGALERREQWAQTWRHELVNDHSHLKEEQEKEMSKLVGDLSKIIKQTPTQIEKLREEMRKIGPGPNKGYNLNP